jgi:hypothetical protein
MWPYDRNISIALGATTIVSGIACYYMYNNESGGGSSGAASVAVAVDGVKVANNVESKAWNISRLFGISKALAVASATGETNSASK